MAFILFCRLTGPKRGCYLWVLCGLLWGPCPVVAQEWQSFATSDGLVNSGVRTVVQSRDGAIWFGTRGGVSRFDGTWQTFTKLDGLSDDVTQSVFLDRDGALWFGTEGGGVSRFDGATWEAFTTQDGLANNFVASIFQSRDGAMWFGTGNRENVLFNTRGAGVSRYDGSVWQTFTTADGLVDNSVFSMLQARDGAIWFGTANGVSRYDGSVWQTLTTADGLVDNSVFSMLQARDGAIWFGTSNGVSRYDGSVWQTFTTADGLTHNFVNFVFEDLDGVMWFATGALAGGGGGGGVSRFDGLHWETFTTADGLANNVVVSIFQSLDGAMWFSTPFGGSRLDRTWRTFTVENGLADNFVGSVVQDRDGVMWFATGATSSGGVSRYDGSEWQTFTVEDGLAGNSVISAVQDRDGAMWFGTANLFEGIGNGVSRYDGSEWQTFTVDDGLADNSVIAMTQSQDGAMWFGTGNFLRGTGGVSRYDGSEWQTFTVDDGLAGNSVQSVFQAQDGAMWFGTSNGASRYDGSEWQTFTVDDGLAHRTVFSVFQAQDGAMWFGTGDPIVGVLGGATRFDGVRWQTFTTADGLADNVVFRVFQDRDGAMWFGTRGGVSRYDGITWQTFTTADGLAGNTVTWIIQDRNGAIWFGTDGGASSFRRPTLALVQTVILQEPPLLLGDSRFFFESQGFEIGSDRQPPLSFALTRGREEPQPNAWSPFSVVNGFQARNMSNGEWTFYARTKDRHGNVDPTPAVSTFLVDLVSPTVVINSPRRNDAVSGLVEIEGSVFDASAQPDLTQFSLFYGRATGSDEVSDWRPIREETVSNPETFRIEDTVIDTWDTQALAEPFGRYVLRIQAEDRLGHRSEHRVPVTLVSALEEITSRDGGKVASSGDAVSLMVPANGLALDRQVQIVFVQAADLPAPPSDAIATGLAYEVGPNDLAFNKRATLTIGYGSVDIDGETDLAVFALSGTTWSRLGGTVEETATRISVGIQSSGTYALFEAPPIAGSAGVSDLACQPRIISPGGNLYPGVTDVSFQLGASAAVDVRIYGVSGNLIREVVLGRRLNAGLNVVQWDGRDRNGQVVKDGLYVVVIEAGGQGARKTVAVLNR